MAEIKDEDIVLKADEFPSNSESSKKQEEIIENKEPVMPRLNKIDKKDITTKKKSLFDQALEIGKDAFGYSIKEVLIPAFKNLVWDMLMSSSRRMIFGDDYKYRSSNSWYDDRPKYTNYSTHFASNYIKDDRPALLGAKELDQIVCRRREQAADILEDAKSYIEKYGSISVSLLYDSAGLSVDYTFEKFGWSDDPRFNLDRARIIPCKEGYLLELPRPIRLD